MYMVEKGLWWKKVENPIYSNFLLDFYFKNGFSDLKNICFDTKNTFFGKKIPSPKIVWMLKKGTS